MAAADHLRHQAGVGLRPPPHGEEGDPHPMRLQRREHGGHVLLPPGHVDQEGHGLFAPMAVIDGLTGEVVQVLLRWDGAEPEVDPAARRRPQDGLQAGVDVQGQAGHAGDHRPLGGVGARILRRHVHRAGQLLEPFGHPLPRPSAHRHGSDPHVGGDPAGEPVRSPHPRQEAQRRPARPAQRGRGCDQEEPRRGSPPPDAWACHGSRLLGGRAGRQEEGGASSPHRPSDAADVWGSAPVERHRLPAPAPERHRRPRPRLVPPPRPPAHLQAMGRPRPP